MSVVVSRIHRDRHRQQRTRIGRNILAGTTIVGNDVNLTRPWRQTNDLKAPQIYNEFAPTKPVK